MPEVVQEIPKEAVDSYISGEHTGKELMNYAQYGFWKSKKQYTQDESDRIFIRNNPDLIFNDLSDNQKIFSYEEFTQIVTQAIVSKLKPSVTPCGSNWLGGRDRSGSFGNFAGKN